MRVHELLTEGKAHRVHAENGEPFLVYENPSREQLDACRHADPRLNDPNYDDWPDGHKKDFGSVKGVLAPDGTLYIWPAWFAHHGNANYHFGTTGSDSLYLYPDAIGIYWDSVRRDVLIDRLRTTPAITRLYGPDPKIIPWQQVFGPMLSMNAEPPQTKDEIRYTNKVRKSLGMKRYRPGD